MDLIIFSQTTVRMAGLTLAGAALLGLSAPANSALTPTQADPGLSGSAAAAVSAPKIQFLGKSVSDPIQPGMILAFSDGATNTVVNRLQGGVAECGALPAEYRADCMAQTYRGAASLANRQDYASARTQLSRTSRSLSGLVAQNADPQAQPLRKGGKTFRAVKKSAVRAVNAKAVAIIAEAETKLLRSASSGLRKVHFQRIAQAVGSTKRIFRS